MADEQRTATEGKWDHLIGELHAMREASGSPSYAELTRRIVARRMAQGQSEHEARIAKSSVHDAFRYGRQRINETLVRELVVVMGNDAAVVDEWVAGPVKPAPVPMAPEPIAVPEPIEPASRRAVALLMVGCVVLNLLGRAFVDFFNFPIHLDMTGTCIAAIALGPWRGAAVGLATNTVGIAGSGWISLPFALVQIVGALAWGYGARKYGMSKTLARYFSLNVLTAVACSLVAIPIIVALVGEGGGRQTVFTELVTDSIHTFVLAVSFSNLLTSITDKLISGFVALVVVSALPLALRLGVSLPAMPEAHADNTVQP